MHTACLLLGALLLTADSGEQGSIRVLSDAQLDRITAGTAEAKPSAGTAEGGVIVAGSSSATLRSSSRVDLHATSPGQPRALNLLNAADSSVSNGVNIWGAGPAGPPAGPTVLLVAQGNHVTQSRGRSARLDFSATGPLLNEFRRSTSTKTFSSSSYFTRTVIDRSSSFSTSHIVHSVDIPESSLFSSPIHIGRIAPNPFTLPGIGFELSAKVLGTGFAVSASLGPFTISPGSVDFGYLDLRQDTLRLTGGQITLPALSFPASISGEACVLYSCVGGSASTTFNLGFGALGTINVPDIVLGPNPFKDIRIQPGGGISGAGSGRISVSGGNISLGLGLSLTLPPIPGVTLSFPNIPVNLPPIPAFTIPGWSVSTPDITFPTLHANFPLINQPLGGFNLSYNNAAFCVTVFVSCQMSENVAQFSSSSSQEYNTFSFQTGGYSASQEMAGELNRHLVFPAALLGAQAGYIAVLDSSLAVETDAAVQLSGPVQQGMTALNMVNAAASTLANGLNVSRSVVPGQILTLSQNNSIRQRP